MKDFTDMTNSQLDTEIFFSKRYSVRAGIIAVILAVILCGWLIMGKPLPSDFDGTRTSDLVQFGAIFTSTLAGYFAWFFNRNADRALEAMGCPK